MGTYPKYSNLYPELRAVLDSRAENTNKPWLEGGVSGLSTWIRVISTGKSVDDDGPGGLVMQSVHQTEGDSAQRFENSYGNLEKPGILGYQLDMTTPVSVVGRGLRPSPVITSFNVEERQAGALKISKFVIKCFTKEQTDEVAKYFLEPGFHVLLEWGWNVNDSFSQRVGGGGEISVCEILEYTNWTYIKNKRKDSNYQYDASLGIVSGGGVNFAEGETYDIEVQISGTGQVAEYMQTQSGGNRTNESDDNNPTPFEPEKIGKSTPGSALFKQMFNALPEQKQTKNIRAWVKGADSNGIEWAYPGNYVNFDENVRDYLQKTLTKGATIRNKSGDKLAIPNDTAIFSKERFIRFELAIAILNDYVVDLSHKASKCSGVKSSLLTIDTTNTVIKAFPHMWSTDSSVLYIPNTTAPSFGLKEALTDSDSEEPVKFINFKELDNDNNLSNLHPMVEEAPAGNERAEANGSANDPSTGQTRPVPFAFPCTYDLDESVLNYDCDETINATEEKAGFWGWLNDLYINYNFFCEVINKKNLNSIDVMYELLNGMNGAVNGLWDFQLREGPKQGDADGPNVLAIEDVSFRGFVAPEVVEGIATYEARGVRSPFTSISWKMSVPGAMQSNVVIKNMSANTVDGSGDTPYLHYGGVYSDPATFENQIGTALYRAPEPSEDSDGEDQQEEQQTEEVPSNAKAFSLFAQKAGVFSRVQDRKGKIDIVENLTDKEQAKAKNGVIESLLCVGTWNDLGALKAVELIDRGIKVDAGIEGSVDLSYTQRVNPIPGLASIDFSVQGLSGFKVGDMMQFEGTPFKFGPPSFYQITGVGHTMGGMTWTTNIKCDFRMIGGDE